MHLSCLPQSTCDGKFFPVAGEFRSMNTFSERIRLCLVLTRMANSPERRFGCRRGGKAANKGYLREAVAFRSVPHQLARRDRNQSNPAPASKGLKPAQGPSCALLRNPWATPMGTLGGIDGH
jgi:hypothetical protein